MSPVHVLGGMGAVHTHTNRGTRECARDGCPNEFRPREAKHRFCSQACRNAQWKVDRQYTDRRAAKPSRNGSAAKQKVRPPRVRPTLTRKEAFDLTSGRRTKDRARALQKIADALIRSGHAHG